MEDLVSRVEIAEMLGISRQRLHQLIAAGGFPPPLVELGIGAVWRRADVTAWARSAGRRPVEDDESES